MPLTLDHVVIASADLDATIADYRKLGFTVLQGGDHPGGVTYNALVIFQDGSYLELIAFRRADPNNRWSRVFEKSGAGFLDHALLPSDIATDVAAAQKRGLDMADPIPGGRLRPDGEKLEWKTARSPKSDVPFFCGDVTPRSLRVQEGDVRVHPNGVTGIAAITLAVTDLDVSLKRYAALLDLDVPPAPPSRVLAGFGVRSANLPLGHTVVNFVSPLTQTGPVAEALAARGEGPFALAFSGGKQAGDLDPALASGARLTILGA